MSKIIVYMSMSLDGFIAGANNGPNNGLGEGGELLHAWLSAGSIDPTSYRPEQKVNAEIFDEMLDSGAVITGRRTFEWANEWGGNHHDNVPIFVLTHNVPASAVKGNIHYFDNIRSAVAQAKKAAGNRNVMMHGASTVQMLLRMGLIDEFVITLVPALLGQGHRLFDDSKAMVHHMRLTESRVGEGVLHLRYLVENPGE